MVFCFCTDSKLKHGVYEICKFLPVGADLCPKGWYISMGNTASVGGNGGRHFLPKAGNLKGTSGLV